jgi:hypothetical protein
MNMYKQRFISLAVVALCTAASAQTATTSAGRAASAAVTPGDQNMGRNHENRTGGLMGQDTAAGTGTTSVGRAAKAAVTPGDQNMGRNPDNRTGGLMGTDRPAADGSATTTSSGSNVGTRVARADRN